MFSFRFWSAPAVVEDPKVILNDIRAFSASGNVRPIELRQAIESYFKKFMLSELETYSHVYIITAVLHQQAWPETKPPRPDAKPDAEPEFEREFEAKNNDLAKVKAELLAAMENIADVNLKLNALLQSLCKITLLGRIFHTPRGMTWPSIEKGSLRDVAIQLEQTILHMNDQSSYQLLEETKVALQKEVARNPSLNASLIKYPNLQLLVSNVTPHSARKLTN